MDVTSPRQVDRRQFTIKSCLGRGGFGEVYRAVMTNATGLETEVAVKVLHHDLDRDSQAIQRLKDEGRMLGVLTHASILRVYDLVLLDGRIGLVLEYIEGQDLSKCIAADVAMPLRAVVATIGRVADALRAAWETPTTDGTPLHMIHRDIKPQNIRIGTQGDVKLLDFGVARTSNVGRESETRTGNMVGSYLYMAPECLLENRFGPESDVFALGATMFEALAHKRLFQDQSLRELYVLVLKEEDYQEHIDTALERIEAPESVKGQLRSMLARDRTERPTAAQISSICDELDDTLDGDSLRRWCKNRDWPPVAAVNGLLDGRTITEATIASMNLSDFSAVPPPRKRKIDMGLLLGTAGGVAALLGTLVGLIGLTVGVVLFALPQNPGSRLIQPPTPGPIGAFATPEFDTPERAEEGTAPAPVAPTPEAPRSRPRAVMVVDSAAPVTVRLVGGGRSYGPGQGIPVGTYSLRVDWGEGARTTQQVTVGPETRTIPVKCNRFTRACSAG